MVVASRLGRSPCLQIGLLDLIEIEGCLGVGAEVVEIAAVQGLTLKVKTKER